MSWPHLYAFLLHSVGISLAEQSLLISACFNECTSKLNPLILAFILFYLVDLNRWKLTDGFRKSTRDLNK